VPCRIADLASIVFLSCGLHTGVSHVLLWDVNRKGVGRGTGDAAQVITNQVKKRA